VFAGETLGRRLVERRWQDLAPGYELCDEIETRYQNLAIGRRAEQFTLYCDGHVSVDFPDPYTFVPLAHFWMCQHPLPRRVLVLGGGAEGLLAEILKHPVDEVDYVEPDPRQIELVERYLPEPDRRALRDPRVRVHTLDARYFIKGRHGRYDLVVARLPEPTSALRARFYTDEFYREVRRAMTDRSVFCLTAAAAPADLPAAPATYLASIRATLRRHFPHVTVGWGDTAQILAATATGLVTTDPAELAARYTRRGVQSALFHPLWFDGATDWLDADKLRARSGQLDAAENVQVSTDLHPAVYMQRLAMWEKMTGGPSSRLIERLRSVSWSVVLGVIVTIGVITLIVCRLRGRSSQAHGRMLLNPWAGGTVVLSIGTTGFATMALSMIWLFAFQNLYGYVYQRIGWIIALFMAGLVIGCWAMERASRRLRLSYEALPAGRASACGDPAVAVRLWRRLIVVDVLIALLAVAVPVLLPALGAWQDSRPAFVLVEWAISAMVALTGVLCGAAFALAGGLQFIMTGRAGATAGSIVGADHAGACLGALFTGVLLVPVFGTPAAAYLLVGIKLGSALLLWLVYRAARAA
jgi:spermidine synthase